MLSSDCRDVRIIHHHEREYPRSQVCQLAPMLAEIKECWPAKGNQVRLPGGKYVTPEMSEHCKLYDASGVRIAETGPEAAAAILTYQTPAEIVPDYPPDPEPDQMPHTQAGAPIPSLAPLPVEADDHPTVAQLIRWFNDTHPLDSILPRQGDYANLPGQHHPSVSYYPPDSTHTSAYWYDHGGTHQHGDAFELYCLVSGRSKREVLRDLPADWIAHRRGSAIEMAALSQPQTRIDEDETCGGALSASQAPAQPVPVETNGTHATPETFAAELGLTLGEPCKRCGCTLRYESRGELMCHKCHPRPLRLGGLTDEQWRRLLALFPRE